MFCEMIHICLTPSFKNLHMAADMSIPNGQINFNFRAEKSDMPSSRLFFGFHGNRAIIENQFQPGSFLKVAFCTFAATQNMFTISLFKGNESKNRNVKTVSDAFDKTAVRDSVAEKCAEKQLGGQFQKEPTQEKILR